MNAGRIQRAIHFLERKIPPGHFDMHGCIEMDIADPTPDRIMGRMVQLTAGESDGTTLADFHGWLPVIFPQTFQYLVIGGEIKVVRQGTKPRELGYLRAAQFLGLQSVAVFLAETYEFDEVTPVDVADFLLQTLKRDVGNERRSSCDH